MLDGPNSRRLNLHVRFEEGLRESQKRLARATLLPSCLPPSILQRIKFADCLEQLLEAVAHVVEEAGLFFGWLSPSVGPWQVAVLGELTGGVGLLADYLPFAPR